jgi:2-polyprenyl-3-methyl-5-hydroxy-6-metoxy-1,4-benzoquinol methylase
VYGQIENTIHAFRWSEPKYRYDLMVCTETIEHLNDPDVVLEHTRDVANHLLLTTPNTENGHTENEEHVWEWDTDAVADMLVAAGWSNIRYHIIECDYYDYQLWLCS